MRKIRQLEKYRKQIGFYSLIHYLFQRIILRRKIVSIHIKGLIYPIHLRNIPDDYSVFTQIFVDEEYDVELHHEVKNIIDCGANIGLATLYFIKKYPNCNIICIEPDVSNFEMLQKNTQNYKNVNCLNNAVWHVNKKLTLTNPELGKSGLRVGELSRESQSSIEGITISKIMKDSGMKTVEILKLDVEGSEKNILLYSDINYKELVKNIFVEIHENMYQGLREEIISHFQEDFLIKKHGEYHVLKNRKWLA